MSSPETPTTRVRNARGDGARLRDEIVDAATMLLQTCPAEMITLRAIARATGVTAPSIYRHFDSVDGILRAVIEETFAQLEKTLRAATVSTGADGVWDVSRAYLAFAQDHPEQYRLLFGGAWNAADIAPDALDERRERARIGIETLQVLIDAIAAAVAKGSSASTDPSSDAVALWIALHGLASLRRTTPLFPWPPAIEESIIRSAAHLA